jgi:hypothetical protein
MRVLLRVNNEFFGVLHMSGDDPQESGTDDLPTVFMLPKQLPPEFLFSKGLVKGNGVIVILDENRQIVSLEREHGGGVLWHIA